eukprot:3175175-Prymnesium_polylepis.1
MRSPTPGHRHMQTRSEQHSQRPAPQPLVLPTAFALTTPRTGTPLGLCRLSGGLSAAASPRRIRSYDTKNSKKEAR